MGDCAKLSSSVSVSVIEDVREKGLSQLTVPGHHSGDDSTPA